MEKKLKKKEKNSIQSYNARLLVCSVVSVKFVKLMEFVPIFVIPVEAS